MSCSLSDNLKCSLSDNLKCSLSYKGLGIPLELLTEQELTDIKTELNVKPIVIQGYSDEPETYPMYRINTKKIYLPKFYGLDYLNSKKNKKYTIIDKSKDLYKTECFINTERVGKPIDIKFKGTLKPYQTYVGNNVLNHIAKKDACTLNLFTGAGKTVLALYIISKLKLKTLILVHKVFLMDQFKERIAQFIPDAKIGTIQGTILETKDCDIVIGMIQSISMKEYDANIFDEFGFVITDECFEYNQKIITDKGPVKIGNLYEMWFESENNILPDLKVLSYNHENKTFEYKNITYAWEKTNENLLEIKYSYKNIKCYNNIKCTENHKILTPNGYTEAKNLKTGSLIYGGNKQYDDFVEILTILEIKTIKNPDKKNRVYDIEVGDNHNFVLSSGDNNVCGPIVHNCHHICSKVFSKTLFKVATKKMLGLSATPTRKDGLTKVLNWFVGPILTFEQQSQENIENPVVEIIPAEYENDIVVKYNYKGSVMVPNLINQISQDPKRNEQILDKIIECYDLGRKIIVLSDRRCQCIDLKNMLFLRNYTDCDVYLGGMSKQELENSNSKSIILATYSMASEAYDNPKLDTLIFATGKNDILQSCGRILRKKNENHPLIVDIADKNFQPSQYKKRKMFYRKQKYTIVEEINNVNDVNDEDEETETKLNFRDYE